MQGVIERLRHANAKRVLLQAPEGLKMRLQDMAKALENAGFEAFISMEPTYGACDLRDHEAKLLNCDFLVHIGHTDFGVKPEVPVIYEEYRTEIDPVPLLKEHIEEIKIHKKLALITTIQFQSIVKPAKEFLEKQGIQILTGKQKRSGYEGHILGCDYTAALPLDKEADAYLYIGSGTFHPFGLALKTDKPVLVLDIEGGSLRDLSVEKNKFKIRRCLMIEKARQSKNFGLLITTKKGQMYTGFAKKSKEKLEKLGKNAYYLVFDQITPEKMIGLKLDVLVNCGCPRINEDHELFGKPILNPEDVEKL